MQIITIGRQFGSDGHEIGQRIAQELGFNFYDKELLTLAAKESGFAPELFEQNDERPSSRLLSNLLNSTPFGSPLFQQTPVLSGNALFQIQSNVIRKLAQEQDCVFIGRCADYVLRDHPNLFSIFIHAPLEARVMRIKQGAPQYLPKDAKPELFLNEDKVREFIHKKDKIRATYYNDYTGKSWGAATSYQLCFDSEQKGFIDHLISYLRKT